MKGDLPGGVTNITNLEIRNRALWKIGLIATALVFLMGVTVANAGYVQSQIVFFECRESVTPLQEGEPFELPKDAQALAAAIRECVDKGDIPVIDGREIERD